MIGGLKILGVGTVHKFTPEALIIWEQVNQDLISQGYEGFDLYQEALAMAFVRGGSPYGTASSENTVTTLGANQLWDNLIGVGGVPYTNAAAALGVGDSAAAFALNQTNLQGAVATTDRIRKAMNATFPSVATNVLTAQSTFATTDANFVWNEWGFFNALADATGTMFNRAVGNLGTKTSASAWILTVTLTAA